MNVQSQIGLLEIVQNVQKGIIGVSEEPHTRNGTLDTGKTMKQNFDLFFSYQRKLKRYLILINSKSKFVSSLFQYQIL